MSENIQYWQVAAGDAGRDYAKEFIRYGVAFVGGTAFERMMKEEVKVGHRILIKKGKGTIHAAGAVVAREGRHNGHGDKAWMRDLDGWDLPAYCYVDWHVPPAPMPAPEGLAISTLSRVGVPALVALCDSIIHDHPIRPHEPEPEPGKELEDEQLIDQLIIHGLSIGSAEGLSDALRRIRRLVNYYYHNEHWRDVREHETRTFLVVPLLLSLGWPEQCIKIEEPVKGGRMDLALYDKPYFHTDARCQVIIETKGFSEGLQYASDQASAYAEHHPDCRTILVTNGFCYKAHRRKTDGYRTSVPDAYLNLRDPRDRHALYPDAGGALEVLKMLLRTGG
ncbi:MAG: type I restriction enzyme HsdR N-terminal domain-containing protein [Flavobacteriales bacterium]|nr:type I restriction enzyme HsdR N-terminal domain-containing protein [Flavobacteriales bacterium]